MNKTVYEDYKYCIQDVSNIYIGSKYTLGELLENDSIPFKLQLFVYRFLLMKSDEEDTLETHLYYLDEKSFMVKIYKYLKAKVKVSVIENKKHLSGKEEKSYVTKQMTVEQLAKLSTAQKEAMGLIVSELSVNKMALMGL